jgi:hypothetical protein
MRLNEIELSRPGPPKTAVRTGWSYRCSSREHRVSSSSPSTSLGTFGTAEGKRDGIPRSAKSPRSEAEWDSRDLRLGGVEDPAFFAGQRID